MSWFSRLFRPEIKEFRFDILIYPIGKAAVKSQLVFECSTLQEGIEAVKYIEDVGSFRMGKVFQNRYSKVYSLTFFEKNFRN